MNILQLLKELWTNPTPAFDGEHFQLSDVTFSPMPVQKPHPPIWVGGRSRRGVRRAVRYGNAWYPSQLPPEQVAKHADHMRKYSESMGRETPPELSFRGRLNFSRSSGTNERAPLSGTTEDIIADVQQYAEIGVGHISMEVAGDSYADRFRSMDRFMNEVKPRCKPDVSQQRSTSWYPRLAKTEGCPIPVCTLQDSIELDKLRFNLIDRQNMLAVAQLNQSSPEAPYVRQIHLGDDS